MRFAIRLLRSLTLAAAGVVLAAGLVVLAASDKPGEIDWNYARQLRAKETSGQTLTPEERAYLERAKQLRAQQGGTQQPGAPGPAPTPVETTGLVPLDQMSAQDKYKGEDGGLYGGGRNEPPQAQAKAAQAALGRIVPLDAEGRPAPDGKIVLLSMGMSNTTQEFSRFKELADQDPAKSPQVVIVDGAQGGKDAATWDARENTPVWDFVAKRLEAAGVTARQVQVAWVKHARIGPSRFGEFPAHAKELRDHIVGSLQIAQEHFPNLRVAYLSSRIYAGYASTPLNPEPFAYESAFAVRWVILDQAKGDPKLNYDPSRGQVTAPIVLWGPYLWGDGMTPRKSDGLVWKREDLAGDGTHPSPTSGRDKVGGLVLKFFKTDPLACGWFVKPGAK